MLQATLTEKRLQIQCSGLQAAGVELSQPFTGSLVAGQVHVLRGANGVGKSTLLRALANALPGSAVLFKPEYGLRDELIVDQHLQIMARHLNVNRSAMDQALAQVGLSDWQFERIGTLSSGQRARLGLCALLLANFPVWLLDEPLNALDGDGCKVMGEALQAHLSAGGWVLMASHIDPQQMLQHMPGASISEHALAGGVLALPNPEAEPEAEKNSHRTGQSNTSLELTWSALIDREWRVTWANSQSVLWSGLFHWMVLSFFGIGLGKPTVEFAQVAVWISALLAVLLGAKDWFSEDHRVGWMRFIAHEHPNNLGKFWLIRVLSTVLLQTAVLVPVSGLLALQFGLTGDQTFQLLVALVVGVWAMAPLLGLISLLVMLTRGGSVLVYLIALPLLVPVLIFGLEASRAADLGRSASSPLAVMFSLGLLVCLLGPALARRLIQLIQE